jgi:ATP-binding cassette subfamily B protein IrtA
VNRLLRPYLWAFAAVVALQVAGAVAGLAPLLAVVELGRTLLSPGPLDGDHVRLVVLAGAAGLFLRLLFTAASSGIGHVVDGAVHSRSAGSWRRGWAGCPSAGSPGSGPVSWRRSWATT